MLTDSEDVTERWREYIEELYAKDENLKRLFRWSWRKKLI